MRKITAILVLILTWITIKHLPATEQEGILTSSPDLGVWERVEGPYVPQSLYELFVFNNNLFVSSRTHQNINFQRLDDEWIEVTEGMLSDCGRIFDFKEKNNVKVLSTYSGIYVSYNNGLDWENVEPLDGDISLYSVTIVEETIFAQKLYFNSSLHKLEKNSKKWEKVYFSDGVDSIYADRLISYGDYIVAGDYDYEGRHKTGGGITISSDKGITWNKLTNFNQKVRSMAFHNGILFVGALDKHIYKSTNFGQSWSVDTSEIFPVDLFYSEGDNLYAAVNSVAYLDSITPGIHLSTDNGKTWERRHEGVRAINIANLISFQNKLYCLAEDESVYESANKGLIWEKNKILTDSINCLDIVLHNDTLFAGVLQYGITFSTDEGATWDIFSESLIKGKSVSPRFLFKNNKVFGAILSGGLEYIASSDGGKTWSRGGIGNPNPSNPPLNDGNVFEDKFILATDVGLKYTTDLGENWYDFYGGELDSGEATGDIFIDKHNNQDIFYTSDDKGFLKSTDKGKSWELLLTYSDLASKGLYALLKVENGFIYGYDNDLNMIRTSDEGENWNFVAESLTGLVRNTDILFVESSIVAVVDGGIAVSHDNGKTKEEYYLPFNTPDGDPYGFKKCVLQGNYIIAATEMGVLRAKLTDIGITPTSVETQRNYLYTLPPYPLPSQNEVKVQFYWDINLPMTADDISVYDITGRKLITKDKIRLEKQSDHYGNLIWDCSNEEPGIYLINIKHGTEERSVKVVVVE